VDYPFINPAIETNGIDHFWLVRHDGVYLGFGWYE
jgi:hypothetical protein